MVEPRERAAEPGATPVGITAAHRIADHMKIPTYVLNLASDRERFEAIRAQVTNHAFIDLIRVLGVDGRTLPESACVPLTRNKWSVNHKGTLACFLGHARIWEIIARSEGALALVVEDDVDLMNLDVLTQIDLPDGVDLVFCNDRTCYQPGLPAPALLPLAPALAYVAKHGQSIGGDGYLVTRAGAQRLLSYVQKDSFFSHVDLRLFVYGLRKGSVFGISSSDHSIVNNIGAMRRTYDSDHYIEARILSPFVTRHKGGQGSRRAAADVAVYSGE